MQKLTNLQSRRRWRGTALVAHAPFNFWPGKVGPGSKGTIYPPAIIWQNYKQNNLLLLLVSQPDCHTFHCLCWQYRKQKNKDRQSITVVSFQFLDIPTALTFLGPKCANCATKTRAVFLFLFFFSFAWKGSNGVKPCFESCRWIFVRVKHSFLHQLIQNMTTNCSLNYNSVHVQCKFLPGFDPITFTFSENSNYGSVGLRYKGKTLMGDVNKHFVFKSLLTLPTNVSPH